MRLTWQRCALVKKDPEDHPSSQDHHQVLRSTRPSRCRPTLHFLQPAPLPAVHRSHTATLLPYAQAGGRGGAESEVAAALHSGRKAADPGASLAAFVELSS